MSAPRTHTASFGALLSFLVSTPDWWPLVTGGQMDPEDQALTGESAPSESPPDEQDDLTLLDEPEIAESGEQDQDDEQEAEDQPEKPSRADNRVKAVVDERNEVLRAAEEAGLVWDKDAKRFLPKEDAETTEAEDGYEWQPEAAADTGLDYGIEQYEVFWQADPASLEALDNETAKQYPVAVEWFKRAEKAGLNPEAMVQNEWAIFKSTYEFRRTAEVQGQEQRAVYERQAERAVKDDLAKIETEFAQSEGAKAFVKAEVQRFQKEGRTPSEIKAILENIKAVAVYRHLADFTAQAAKRGVQEAEGRKVLLGGQGGQAAPAGDKPVVSLTAEERAICREAGISEERYAARKSESVLSVNGGIV